MSMYKPRYVVTLYPEGTHAMYEMCKTAVRQKSRLSFHMLCNEFAPRSMFN